MPELWIVGESPGSSHPITWPTGERRARKSDNTLRLLSSGCASPIPSDNLERKCFPQQAVVQLREIFDSEWNFDQRWACAFEAILQSFRKSLE